MRFWDPKKYPVVGEPIVSMAIASYLHGDPRRFSSLASLLCSLKAQSWEKWEAVVVHDGKAPELPAFLRTVIDTDPRIAFVETAERKQIHGHPHRAWAIETLCKGTYACFSNDDNWYAPAYFQWLLHLLTTHSADFAYCDMIHSHQKWKPLSTKPVRGHIDVGGFIASRKLMLRHPWSSQYWDFSGDGRYIQLLTTKGRVIKADKAHLFVHN